MAARHDKEENVAEEKEKQGMSNLGLAAILVIAYAGSQFMMLTAIDEKLSALEQRIVTSAGHVEVDVNRVEDTVVQAAKATVEATRAMKEGDGTAADAPAARAVAQL